MSESQSAWLSLPEVQLLLGRCESTVRRLIKRHQMRTRVVISPKGRELRVAWEDLQSVLPEENTHALLPAVPIVRGQAPVAGPSLADASQQGVALDEFLGAMKEVAQTSSAQLGLLRDLQDELGAQRMERGELEQSRREIADCLSSINRTSKAQAAAIKQLDSAVAIEANRARSGVGKGLAAAFLAIACLLAGYFAGNGLFLAPGSNRSANDSRLIFPDPALPSPADENIEQGKQLRPLSPPARVDGRMTDFSKRLASLESQLRGKAKDGKQSDERYAKLLESIRHLQQDLVVLREGQDADQAARIEGLEALNREKSFKLNELQFRLAELKARSVPAK